MQENDILKEITSQIINKSNLKNDMSEIMSLITELFKNKYINKLQEGLNHHITLAKKNPPKEITLLNAIKPFLQENSHKNIDNFINILTNVNVFSSLKENFLTQNKIQIVKENFNFTSEDCSVKEDGVYDIDESCLVTSQSISINTLNFSLILIFLLLFKN